MRAEGGRGIDDVRRAYCSLVAVAAPAGESPKRPRACSFSEEGRQHGLASRAVKRRRVESVDGRAGRAQMARVTRRAPLPADRAPEQGDGLPVRCVAAKVSGKPGRVFLREVERDGEGPQAEGRLGWRKRLVSQGRSELRRGARWVGSAGVWESARGLMITALAPRDSSRICARRPEHMSGRQKCGARSPGGRRVTVSRSTGGGGAPRRACVLCSGYGGMRCASAEGGWQRGRASGAPAQAVSRAG